MARIQANGIVSYEVFEYGHHMIQLNSDHIWPYHTTGHTLCSQTTPKYTRHLQRNGIHLLQGMIRRPLLPN
jgi:hypothetical protein